MRDQEFIALLDERMKEIALEVLQATLATSTSLPSFDEPSQRLRQQLALIKAKDHVTVKEAASHRVRLLRFRLRGTKVHV